MASHPIELVVGLGNPGREYADTRHNAGFWFVDALASAAGEPLRAERKFKAEAGRLAASGDLPACWLLKPQTYMNLSGTSVAAFMRFHKLAAERLLVVHDELDLPTGEVRLKVGGGLAGHNGLKDIARHLGSQAFARIRIGIGHPGAAERVTGHVLKRPDAADAAALEEALARTLESFPAIRAGRFEEVMNDMNRRKRDSKRGAASDGV